MFSSWVIRFWLWNVFTIQCPQKFLQWNEKHKFPWNAHCFWSYDSILVGDDTNSNDCCNDFVHRGFKEESVGVITFSSESSFTVTYNIKMCMLCLHQVSLSKLCPQPVPEDQQQLTFNAQSSDLFSILPKLKTIQFYLSSERKITSSWELSLNGSTFSFELFSIYDSGADAHQSTFPTPLHATDATRHAPRVTAQKRKSCFVQ